MDCLAVDKLDKIKMNIKSYGKWQVIIIEEAHF